MLTHRFVVANDLQRVAIPLEFLGPMGVDGSCTGPNRSHLVDVAGDLPHQEAIFRVGNGINVRVLMMWYLYVWSNCLRRDDNRAPEMTEPSGNTEADCSDSESDMLEWSKHHMVEDDLEQSSCVAGCTPKEKLAAFPELTPDKLVAVASAAPMETD